MQAAVTREDLVRARPRPVDDDEDAPPPPPARSCDEDYTLAAVCAGPAELGRVLLHQLGKR